MKILYILASAFEFTNGCWFDRLHLPGLKLKKRGHEVKSLILGLSTGKEWIEWPDIVVFTRYYSEIYDLFKLINEYKKAGKKIVYELDDDTWTVPEWNHTKYFSDKKKEITRKLVEEADLVTTTTPYLAKKLKRMNKNVAVCPNAIDSQLYKLRPFNHQGNLRIGWTGSVTHYKDLLIVLPVLKELQEKYNFDFIIQGISAQPLLAEIYTYKVLLRTGANHPLHNFYKEGIKVYDILSQMKYEHIPFYPPEFYPKILSQLDLDIGLCPLTDVEFNRSKSANKFYQYAAVGTATIASDVLCYKEVNYRVKNTYKDWKKKLTRLIEDEKFREKILEKQMTFVSKYRDLSKVVEQTWEKHFLKLLK